MDLPRARFDGELLKTVDAFHLVGVDEAGRGPLAGPVVVVAARLGSRIDGLEGLRDSKCLAPGRRLALLPAIRDRAEALAIAWASPREIERENILSSTLSAMRRAVRRAARGLDPRRVLVVVDGNRPILGLGLRQVVIPGADDLSLAVGAASVAAKVVRDAWMCRLDRRYPGYGLAGHKGYGTRSHMASLDKLGPSPAHRRTFSPVRRLLPALVPAPASADPAAASVAARDTAFAVRGKSNAHA